MKIENKKIELQSFDQPPFILERTACGINALIEVLKLPVVKLNKACSIEISKKLLELSEDKISYLSPSGQSIRLHYFIKNYCPNENTINSVLDLADHKFFLFLRTRVID